jgi:integrase
VFDNGKMQQYQKSLQTHSLSVARRHHDEIMKFWDEVVAGDEFEWSWEGEHARTTVKERRLDAVVDEYIKHKQADGLVDSSIKRIRNSMDNLINHLGSGFNYTAISTDDIDSFKRAIASDRTPAGVNVDIRNVRTFCNWLFYTERISRQLPIKELPEPKRKPQHLIEAHIVAIWELDSLTMQMKRIIGFLIATGLRVSSAFQGHMEGNWLVIPADAPYNKSKRELEVNLDSTLHKIWLEMMELKAEWKKSGFKFRSLTGKISKQFKRAIRECGIDDSQHLHNTRHTFAVREWLKSNNIYRVKEQLGHKSPAILLRLCSAYPSVTATDE